MSNEQVAAVYGRALFDAAGEAGVAAAVRRELGEFVTALAASATLRDVLANPQVEVAAKQRVLAELTRGAQPLVANTLHVLAERGRLALVADVQAAFEAMASAEAELVKVDVTTAVELSPEVRKKIAARVAEATGRQVELAASVDAGIVGGLVLRVGDVIVDGSVQARIRQLRRRLATAETER